LLLRVDIDFPYPRQIQNYLNLLFGLKFRGYLNNAKALCRLLNEYGCTALWFPTILTPPDKEFLDLIDAGKHEVGCQVIWHQSEIKKLQTKIKKEIRFFVVHGTGTPINKLLWRRLHLPSIKSEDVIRIGVDVDIDKLCYLHSPNTILKMFKKLKKEIIVITHPTYLNRRSVLSKKGPTFETFRLLLENGIKFENDIYKN